ncbi:MAG: hypothetical protein A2516_07380 [Alphaproteobacteria bacterium RIFOXYD12_FULL_60_8]|nr:MAG: hypothetical protein A2516_07380 [Alphaproteobacteria bacterium RIFOXYD12_FULL_60_8]
MSIPLSATIGKKESPLPPPITEAQLRKVLNDLTQRGTENWLKAKYAEPLGLSKNGGKVLARLLSIEDDNAIVYGISLLNDGRGYVLNKVPKGGNRVAIRLDENFKLITAIAMSSEDEVTPLPLADAESKLREVLATWAEYADTL